MFTQCPQCQKTHSLTLAQLRDSRGMLRCEQCNTLFDGLKLISETEDELAKKINEQTLPWQEKSAPANRYWSVGFVLGLLLLGFQLIYFEGKAVSQNPNLRSRLVTFCQLLHCQLPVYQNIEEFTVMQSSFDTLPDKNYLFRAVIVNQAAFAQHYPNIQLNLLNDAGKTLSQRTFLPSEYLPLPTVLAMSPDAPLEIRLKIAALKTPVSGYSFDLGY